MALEEDAKAALNVPLLRFLQARFEGWSDGVAQLSLSVTSQTLNANDRLHGGVLSTLLDLAAYIAVLPTLPVGQTAVTHNLSISLFGSVALGAELRVEARVVHRGRSLAVVQSEAWSGDKRVALATVCKSLIVLR